MIDGQSIVAEARQWIDTPFHGQQSCRGAGCDCFGLIIGVARELGLPEAQSRWARINDYQTADPDLLRAGLSDMMDEVETPQAGDVLLINIGVPPKPIHMAIYCGGNRMIHTFWSGPARVRETPMGTAHWHAVDSIWRWRIHAA